MDRSALAGESSVDRGWLTDNNALAPPPTQGCKLANWLGLVLFVTAVAGAFAVLPSTASPSGQVRTAA